MPVQVVNLTTPTTGPAGTQQCHEVRVTVNQQWNAPNPRIRVTAGELCDVTPVPDTVTGATLVGACYQEDVPGAGFTIGWNTGTTAVSFEASDGATFFVEDDITAPAFADYWWDVGTWVAPFTQSSRTKGAADSPFVEAVINTGQLANGTPNQGEVAATGATQLDLTWQRQTPGQTPDDVTVTVDAPATATELDPAGGVWEVCRDSAAAGTFNHTVTATNDVDAEVATAPADYTFTGTATGPTNLRCGPTTAISDTGATVSIGADDVPPGENLGALYGTAPGGPYPNVAGNTPAGASGDFTFPVTGLTPSTTYYYLAVHNGTTDTSTECSFTTAAAAGVYNPQCRLATTADGGGDAPVQDTQAHLAATFDGVPATHKVVIAVREVGSPTWQQFGPGGSVPAYTDGDGTTGQTITNIFAPLTPGTDYEFAAQVMDGAGVVQEQSDPCTFTTLADPAFTEPGSCDATDQGRETVYATMQWQEVPVGTKRPMQVQPEVSTDGGTSWAPHFDAHDESCDPQPLPFFDPAAGPTNGLAVFLTGLTPGTTYDVRWRVSYADGTTELLEGCPAAATSVEPVWECVAPTAVAVDGATVNHTSPVGESTTDGFCLEDQLTVRYGTTPGGPYPNSVGPLDPTGARSAAHTLTGLAEDTTYYYVMAAAGVDSVDQTTTTVYQTTTECSFTTANDPTNDGPTVGTVPQPCTEEADPVDPAEPSTSVDDECLQDDGGVFFRRVVDDGEGNLTVTTVDVAGAPYTPVGEVGPCSEEQAAHVPVAVEAHSQALGDGQQWTPAAVTGGRLLSVAMTVVSGVATVVDQDGTVVGPLPAGSTLSWSVTDDRNTLDGPQSITAGGGGTTTVAFTEGTP